VQTHKICICYVVENLCLDIWLRWRVSWPEVFGGTLVVCQDPRQPRWQQMTSPRPRDSLVSKSQLCLITILMPSDSKFFTDSEPVQSCQPIWKKRNEETRTMLCIAMAHTNKYLLDLVVRAIAVAWQVRVHFFTTVCLKTPQWHQENKIYLIGSYIRPVLKLCKA
jgi:hypothetical protein